MILQGKSNDEIKAEVFLDITWKSYEDRLRKTRQRLNKPENCRCQYCGKMFLRLGSANYCSNECKQAAKRKPHEKTQRVSTQHRIDEIEKEARTMGLNYGKYQAKKWAEQYARVEV